MRGRSILFVVLAVVLALVGVYVGWSTSSPQAAADAPATLPSSLGPAQEAGSTRSRSPAGRVPKAPPPKGSQQQGNPPKGNPQAGDTPAAPPSSKPQRATGPVSFGKVTTTPSNNTLETAISPDRRALTTTFSAFEVIVNGKVTEPDATKSFAMTLPLTDGATGDVVGFHVQGFAFAAEGATARVTLRGGGKVKVRDFPSGADKDVVESLWLPATPGITYQLSVVIEIHKDATGRGDGYLNAAVVDVGIS
jgi:hypothetical protein